MNPSRDASHLASFASVDTVVEAWRHIPAHFAQQHHAVDFFKEKDEQGFTTCDT